MPATDRVVARLLDLRIPLTLTSELAERLVAILSFALGCARAAGQVADIDVPELESTDERNPG
jgi:hypothetical protein